jgi:hypothetical protein
VFIGRILYPEEEHQSIASVRTASFGPAGVFAGIICDMSGIRQTRGLVASGFPQRLPTASNGDKRGPECQKGSSLRLKPCKAGCARARAAGREAQHQQAVGFAFSMCIARVLRWHGRC